MLTILLSMVLPAIYLAGVAVSTRIIHTRRAVEWMRWKNECPEDMYRLYNEYGGYGKSRKNVTLSEYIVNVSDGLGRPFALLWPFMGPVALTKKFCFPEVEIPDLALIQELEGGITPEENWKWERRQLKNEIANLKEELEIERELRL